MADRRIEHQFAVIIRRVSEGPILGLELEAGLLKGAFDNTGVNSMQLVHRIRRSAARTRHVILHNDDAARLQGCVQIGDHTRGIAHRSCGALRCKIDIVIGHDEQRCIKRIRRQFQGGNFGNFEQRIGYALAGKALGKLWPDIARVTAIVKDDYPTLRSDDTRQQLAVIAIAGEIIDNLHTRPRFKKAEYDLRLSPGITLAVRGWAFGVRDGRGDGRGVRLGRMSRCVAPGDGKNGGTEGNEHCAWIHIYTPMATRQFSRIGTVRTQGLVLADSLGVI